MAVKPSASNSGGTVFSQLALPNTAGTSGRSDVLCDQMLAASNYSYSIASSLCSKATPLSNKRPAAVFAEIDEKASSDELAKMLRKAMANPLPFALITHHSLQSEYKRNFERCSTAGLMAASSTDIEAQNKPVMNRRNELTFTSVQPKLKSRSSNGTPSIAQSRQLASAPGGASTLSITPSLPTRAIPLAPSTASRAEGTLSTAPSLPVRVTPLAPSTVNPPSHLQGTRSLAPIAIPVDSLTLNRSQGYAPGRASPSMPNTSSQPVLATDRLPTEGIASHPVIDNPSSITPSISNSHHPPGSPYPNSDRRSGKSPDRVPSRKGPRPPSVHLPYAGLPLISRPPPTPRPTTQQSSSFNPITQSLSMPPPPQTPAVHDNSIQQQQQPTMTGKPPLAPALRSRLGTAGASRGWTPQLRSFTADLRWRAPSTAQSDRSREASSVIYANSCDLEEGRSIDIVHGAMEGDEEEGELDNNSKEAEIPPELAPWMTQAAPMVLNLDDLTSSTPEVLEMEVSRMTLDELLRLKDLIDHRLDGPLL